MVQRMSDEHKIKFLDNEQTSEIFQKAEESSKKTLDQISEEQKAKKLIHKDNGMMTSRHISSARTGGVTDEGGPSTYFKSEISNTIWSNDKIAEKSKEIDNKTKTLQEKEKIATNRREAEQERMTELADNLKDTDQTKASSILLNGIENGSNYKMNNNSMSMFDKIDFQRMEEKTGGEKISEEVQNRKNQKDESWRNGGKAVSSKELKNKFFDNLMGNKE